MIERQLQAAPAFDKTRFGRIVAAPGLTREGSYEECSAHRVPARIALRIGIDANERDDFAFNASFFLEFAQRRRFHRLAHVNEPTWQRVEFLERWMLALDQQQAVGVVEHDAVDREQWCPRFGHNARSIAPSSDAGFAVGGKRAITLPSRPTKNLVK